MESLSHFFHSLRVYLDSLEGGVSALGFAGLLMALFASTHALLHKRDTRSTISWMGLIWLSPFIGAFLYFFLGVNRIQRRARLMRPREGLPPRESLGENIGVDSATLLRLGDAVTRTPAVPGNSILPLADGDEAYPAMLRAIQGARFSISLCTYIFDVDEVGMAFAEALEGARRRGVQVRVLIDDVGSRYSLRRMHRVLQDRGVPVALFLPLFRPSSFFFINLRLHRKCLVVDGMTAFTGGINIRQKHCLKQGVRNPVRDLHFEIRGPVVRDLQLVFVSDWSFTTGEALRGSSWFPALSEAGQVLARCVDDGPDFHIDNARWILLGAIASSQASLRVVTPYFLPDAALITALNTAALRGIRVQILVPEKSNLPWVDWASKTTLAQLMERGCEVYYGEKTFDHSKLMTVDGRWAFVGSANWDPRSLRLNFELNVEAFDTAFAKQMDEVIDKKMVGARRLKPSEIAHRKFMIKIRDGIARLFSPYL
jgi:cardiolipin synthase A/B